LILIAKHRNATCKQVDIIKALFKYLLCNLSAMSFVVHINNEQLVSFVLYHIELVENLVSLDVHGWETDCIQNAPFQKVLNRT
jgi:hypothetical protein